MYPDCWFVTVGSLVALWRRSRLAGGVSAGAVYGAKSVLSRLARVAILLVVFMAVTGGAAFGVVGGRTVSISAAPWAVVLRQTGRMICTGVIIDRRHVLTAEHCMMSNDSATPAPVSGFSIEAGVSNFRHPHASDDPQTRAVSSERLISGYTATRKVTIHNGLEAAGHDLAVLTLSKPLDLNGTEARAAHLPAPNGRVPSGATGLVMAGFGDEKQYGVGKPKPVYSYVNGTLNEVTKSTVLKVCSNSRLICVDSNPATCYGDSGAGLIEPGQRPIVLGILAGDQADCYPGLVGYMSLTSPAVLHFIKSSM